MIRALGWLAHGAQVLNVVGVHDTQPTASLDRQATQRDGPSRGGQPRSAQRILALCAIVLVVAQLRPMIDHQVFDVWRQIGPGWCSRAPGLAPDSDTSPLCVVAFRWPSLPVLVLSGLVLLALLAACYPAVRWCLRPLRDVVAVIGNVGP